MGLRIGETLTHRSGQDRRPGPAETKGRSEVPRSRDQVGLNEFLCRTIWINAILIYMSQPEKSTVKAVTNNCLYGTSHISFPITL
jgi:hypothetical protein